MNVVLSWFKRNSLGILISGVLAVIGILLSKLIPYGLISGGVFALLICMALNPLFAKNKKLFSGGFNFTSKIVLKTAIVCMGVTLSFSQVLEVGKFSLIVMSFTLVAAFGFGYLFGKLFKMNWKLSSLISAGTGICGGSAIAAISPVIDAKDSDVAYAISATFIFDIIMVIVFPLVARAIGMSDMGYGLWAGTAVNDTSSVVAAGYAYSDAAGNFAVIVKLTRTLSIIPIVILFSALNTRLKRKEFLKQQMTPQLATKGATVGTLQTNVLENSNVLNTANSLTASNNNLVTTPPENILAARNQVLLPNDSVANNAELAAKQIQKPKINWKKIFPWFIILFLVVVGIKSTGILPQAFCTAVSDVSKFFMFMALGAIGLKTNFKSVAKSGFKPMLHGFIISTLVVFVAFGVQAMLGQL